jgi:hypothetical protein
LSSPVWKRARTIGFRSESKRLLQPDEPIRCATYRLPTDAQAPLPQSSP